MVTKVKVLNRFLEVFGLRLKKHPPLEKSGGTSWQVVDKNGSTVYYEPNYEITNTSGLRINIGLGSSLYACGPRTDILDTLLSPTTYSLFVISENGTTFLNPLAGCKTLEEALLKLDLISKA